MGPPAGFAMMICNKERQTDTFTIVTEMSQVLRNAKKGFFGDEIFISTYVKEEVCCCHARNSIVQ